MYLNAGLILKRVIGVYALEREEGVTMIVCVFLNAPHIDA